LDTKRIAETKDNSLEKLLKIKIHATSKELYFKERFMGFPIIV